MCNYLLFSGKLISSNTNFLTLSCLTSPLLLRLQTMKLLGLHPVNSQKVSIDFSCGRELHDVRVTAAPTITKPTSIRHNAFFIENLNSVLLQNLSQQKTLHVFG